MSDKTYARYVFNQFELKSATEKLLDKHKSTHSFYHLKRDGYCIQASKDEKGRLKLWTRSMTCIFNHNEFEEECPYYPYLWNSWLTPLKQLPLSTTVLGELFVPGKPAVYMRNALSRNPEYVAEFEVFCVWRFCGNLNCVDKSNPQREFARAVDLTQRMGLEYIKFSDHFDLSKLPAGYEGYVLKDGQRPGQAPWLKVKDRDTVDLRIYDYVPGVGKYLNMVGSVKAKTDDGLLNCSLSGMNDTVRDMLTKNQEQFLGTVIEVAYTEATENGSLKHPRFIRFREDKNTTN